MHNLLKLTFRDELPDELWPVGGDRWNAVVLGLLKQPRNLWWDDVTTPEVTESRDDILRLAMTNARKEITSLMARDTDEWSWGRLHTVTLRNQTLGMSGTKPVEALFNRGPYEVGGGPAVVNAMAYDTTEGLHSDQRADHADGGRPRRPRPVPLGQPVGVSGHAFHRNYADQTDLWARNETWPFVASGPPSRPGPSSGWSCCPAAGSTDPDQPVRVAEAGRGIATGMINKMLDAMATRIERAMWLDSVADPVAEAADKVLSPKWLTNLLSGTRSAIPCIPARHYSDRRLDLVRLLRRHRPGGRRRPGRTRCAGSAVPTAVAGFSDWRHTAGAERRVGLMHVVANNVATCAYAASWFARRAGQRKIGVVLSLVEATAASVGGWLGGHLSYAKGSGVDTRVFQRTADRMDPIWPRG